MPKSRRTLRDLWSKQIPSSKSQNPKSKSQTNPKSQTPSSKTEGEGASVGGVVNPGGLGWQEPERACHPARRDRARSPNFDALCGPAVRWITVRTLHFRLVGWRWRAILLHQA